MARGNQDHTRLSWDRLGSMHIIARNRANRIVFLGGLGVMGVGQMWSPESSTLASLAGFQTAPERDIDDLAADLLAAMLSVEIEAW